MALSSVMHPACAEVTMEARRGDRVIVEGNKVGQARRSGQILAVMSAKEGQHYRVRWDDGHETVFYPGADARIDRSGSPGS
jgi:hypothetical protein